MLKNMRNLIPCITPTVNKSLNSATFPMSFKSATVKPLLKKPSLDADDFCRYRPVSNLTFISKVLERVALSLSEGTLCPVDQPHMGTHELYEKHQSVYHCCHSPETALAGKSTNGLWALDNSCGIFLVKVKVQVYSLVSSTKNCLPNFTQLPPGHRTCSFISHLNSIPREHTAWLPFLAHGTIQTRKPSLSYQVPMTLTPGLRESMCE